MAMVDFEAKYRRLKKQVKIQNKSILVHVRCIEHIINKNSDLQKENTILKSKLNESQNICKEFRKLIDSKFHLMTQNEFRKLIDSKRKLDKLEKGL